MFQAYKNLSSKTRGLLGLGIIAWGAAGIWLSDRIEEKYEAPPEDKAVLDKYTPRIITVDRK